MMLLLPDLLQRRPTVEFRGRVGFLDLLELPHRRTLPVRCRIVRWNTTYRASHSRIDPRVEAHHPFEQLPAVRTQRIGADGHEVTISRDVGVTGLTDPASGRQVDRPDRLEAIETVDRAGVDVEDEGRPAVEGQVEDVEGQAHHGHGHGRDDLAEEFG